MLRIRPSLSVLLLLSVPLFAGTQQKTPDAIWTVVKNELAADTNLRSHLMYKEAKKVPERSTVKLVIETSKANLSKLLEINGHALTPDQRQADEKRRQKLIDDPTEQQKQAHDRHSDGKQARELLGMLPTGFIWTKVSDADGVSTFKFAPNPDFDPPTREAQVFAAMAGTMTIDDAQMRLKSLKGTLTQDVEFGWGILGKLRKGGTFNIERAEVAPGIWEIVGTHVHISGRALLFKSIDQNEDEITSDYKRVPDSLSLQEAAAILQKTDNANSAADPRATAESAVRHRGNRN